MEWLETFLTTGLVPWVTALIAIAGAIQTVLPSVGGNKVYNTIMKVLNFVALNFGKAKNADDK